MDLNTIQIKSINIRGSAEWLIADHQSAKSAYNKEPISSNQIFLSSTGFEGDVVVDKKHHGGNDKAVCCYSADRFLHWEKTLNVEMKNGAFGENLTLIGENSLEENIYIGDRYQLGEAIVEVSEPRGPCYMIGIKYNNKKFPLYCQETGYTGFYFRTIREGIIKNGKELVKIYSHPKKISVAFVNHTRYYDFKNKVSLQKLVELNELTLEWREKLALLFKKLP